MANKSVLIAGGICVVLALASFGIAYASGVSGVEDVNSVEPNEFIRGPNSTFSYTYTADMAAKGGSPGWYIMMDGEYLDNDENGRTDSCQNITFTVTDSQGVNVTEEASEFSCTAPSEGNAFSDEWYDPISDDGRILFAYVCATVDTTTGYDCAIGETYTITSDSQIYFMDKAELDGAYMKAGAKVLGGVGLAGIGSCCCGLGGILLLVGALTGKKPALAVGMIPQQGAVIGMQVPVQGQQPMGQMPTQQYTVGADIDSSSVADTPVSVWDN